MAKFKVSGDYITNQARDMFWNDKRPYEECEKFISSFFCGDTCSDIKFISRKILEYRSKLVGINEFNLIDETCEPKPISDSLIKKHENLLIDAIREDMAYHARKYIDMYAVDKSWLYFIDGTPQQAYQYAYSDAADIARYVRGSNLMFIEGVPILGEPLDLSYVYDDSQKHILDHGAYLVFNPQLVYSLIGEPVNGCNIRAFYDALYDYWEKSELKDNPLVKARQKKYLQAKKAYENIYDKIAKDAETELTDKSFCGLPDDGFSSHYGIIDPDGRWYNVDWGKHSLKAKSILEIHFGCDEKMSLYKALDTIIDQGYILIRDVLLTGAPTLYGKQPNSTQKQTIDSYCNYWGLDGLEWDNMYYF